MKIGYTNSDIAQYLDDQREKWGAIWYIVAAFDAVEWENFAKASSTMISGLSLGLAPDQQARLKINGILYQILKVAKEEGYPEVDLIRSFLEIAGDQINPTMSMQPLPKDKVAVIFTFSRQVIKDNMSPRRGIDVEDSLDL